MKSTEKRTEIFRIIKKIIAGLAISCVALLILSLVLSFVYRDKITNFVTQELLSQLNGTVEVEKIDVSFLHSFPNVSIQLHSLQALSTEGFNKSQFEHNYDTALFAKQLSLGFNLLDFFNQRYIVQNIQLNNARVFYCIDAEGNHNWNFIKPSNDTTKNYFIDLSKISLHNSEITLHLLPQELHTRQNAEELHVEGNFFSDTIRCSVESELHSEFVKLSNATYARNYDVKLKTAIAIDGENVHIENLNAKLPFLDCDASAQISLNEQTHIAANYTLNIPSFQRLQPELPENVISEIAQYAIDGKIFAKGWCKGIVSNKKLPALEAQVICEKGQLTVKKELLKFSFNTTVKTTDLGKTANYQLGNTKFEATCKNSNISGTSTINNFENLSVDLQAQTNIDIANIAAFASSDYVFKGTLNGKLNYKGSLLDWEKFSPNFFTKNTLSAQLKAENVSIAAPQNLPFSFAEITGNLAVQNSNVQIDSVSGTVQNNTFLVHGNAQNIIPYIMCNNQLATFTGNVQLNELNLNPFMDYFSSQTESNNSDSDISAEINLVAQAVQYEEVYLKNVKTKLSYKNGDLQMPDFTAKTVQYDTFELTDVNTNFSIKNSAVQLSTLSAQSAKVDKHVISNLKTKLLYANNSLQLSNTSGRFLTGSFDGQAQLTFNFDKSTLCKASGNLHTIPIREVMIAFNNFDQSFLTAEQINGIAAVDFTLAMELDKNNNVDYSKMELQSKINVKKGGISNFEPFIEMGKKLKVEEFKHVTFNNIENTLTIKNDTVYIPHMDIFTNAFELKFAGTHAISSSQFKYFMTLYLKKTLTHMFQKRNKTEDFGEIEQNTDGNILLPLKLFGTPEKFNIDYDFKVSLKNVKQGMEQQKNEWRTILSGGKEPEIIENTTNNTNENTTTNSTPPSVQPKKNEPAIKSGFEIEYD